MKKLINYIRLCWNVFYVNLIITMYEAIYKTNE